MTRKKFIRLCGTLTIIGRAIVRLFSSIPVLLGVMLCLTPVVAPIIDGLLYQNYNTWLKHALSFSFILVVTDTLWLLLGIALARYREQAIVLVQAGPPVQPIA